MSSLRTREIVGYLFADLEFKGVQSSLDWMGTDYYESAYKYSKQAVKNAEDDVKKICDLNRSNVQRKLKSLAKANPQIDAAMQARLITFSDFTEDNRCNLRLVNAVEHLELGKIRVKKRLRRKECMALVESLISQDEVLLMTEVYISQHEVLLDRHSECKIEYAAIKSRI